MFKAKSAGRSEKGAKGFRGEIEELVALLRAYVVQETVGPLRGIGRFIAFGLAGSVFISIGILFACVGLLRLLQTEVAVFDNRWSFVPYLITAAAMLVILAALIGAVSGGDKKPDKPEPATQQSEA